MDPKIQLLLVLIRTNLGHICWLVLKLVAQVVLHMLNKNDLVVCLHSPREEDRVGELAAVLATVKGSVPILALT